MMSFSSPAQMDFESDEAIEEDFVQTDGCHAKSKSYDTMEDLINLQAANGHFEAGKAIEFFSGLTDSQINETSPAGVTLEDWCTALAIAIFEGKFAADKDLWELVVTKAKKFLALAHPNNYDEILNNAKAAIKA